MADTVDQWSAAGLKNIFGHQVKVVEMESEAGAAGSVHEMCIRDSPNSGAALLVSRSTLLPLAVDVALEGGDRQAVAVHTGDGLHNVADLLEGNGSNTDLSKKWLKIAYEAADAVIESKTFELYLHGIGAYYLTIYRLCKCNGKFSLSNCCRTCKYY